MTLQTESHADDAADLFVDLRGLKCPEPLLMVRKTVRGMRIGEVLHVVATDPTTQRDIPQFCRFLEHALLEARQDGEEFHFRLRKGARTS